MTTKPKAAARPKGLGMGLAQLLGGADSLSLTSSSPSSSLGSEDPAAIHALPLAVLQAGRYQPRTRMDESALQELATSIKKHGVMQPILVRKLAVPQGAITHEIIAGERRFRASKLAGLTDVPVIVREVDDENTLALALIENIQREDLNPLEEAQAIKRLIEEFSYSHEQAAEAIGRSRSATSNLLRLLNLAEPVQTALLAGDLDMGHARALLALDKAQQILLAHQVIEKRLSVRETEKLVNQAIVAAGKTASQGGAQQAESRVAKKPDLDVARLSEQISDALGAVAELKPRAKQSGELTIKFATHEQLKGLLERLGIGELLEN
jgi:ParB family transcriptional regulator, chromosome partitioning protein